MTGLIATSGRAEITLFAGPSCMILIGELKRQFVDDESAVLAQMLCEADGIHELAAPDLLCVAADYMNWKNGMGATPIYCMLMDKKKWKFYKVCFDESPWKVQKSKKEVTIDGDEGTVRYLVSLKEGKLRQRGISDRSMRLSFIIPVVRLR
jgi:hypothetical protein